MMSSNESLGNGLLFPDDPFISGVEFIEDNDNIFEELFKDPLLFDQESNNLMPRMKEESRVELMEEDSLFDTLSLQETVGIYGFNPLDSFDILSTSDIAPDLLFSEERMNSQMNIDFDSQPKTSTEITPENVVSVGVQKQIVGTEETSREMQKVSENNNYEFEEDRTASQPVNTVSDDTTIVKNQPVAKQPTMKINRVPFTQPSKLAAAFKYMKHIPHNTPKYVTNQQPAYKAQMPASNQPKTLYPVKVLPSMIKKNLSARPIASVNQMRKQVTNRRPLFFPGSKSLSSHAQPLQNFDSNIPEPENSPINQENTKDGYEDDILHLPEQTVGSVLKRANFLLKMSELVPRDHLSHHIKCNYCKDSFKTQLALEFHEVERHPYVYAYRCTLCDEIYSTIQVASKHVFGHHKADAAPLLNNAIFGNSPDNEPFLRNANRRISGMIWSFLSNYLLKNGKITGTAVRDNETIKQHAKALFQPSKPDPPNVGNFKARATKEETAEINDLLKIAYIYGPSISRLRVDEVPTDKVVHFSEPEMFETVEEKPPTPTVPMCVFPPKKTIVFHAPPKVTTHKNPAYILPPLPSQKVAMIKEKMIPVFMPTTAVRPLIGNKKIEYHGTIKGQQVFKVRQIVKSQMPALVRRIDSSSPSCSYSRFN